MNEELSLAGMGQGKQQGPQGGRGMIQQVKQMLAQGMSPEALVAQGIPQAIIQQAMAELQMEAQQVNNSLAGMDERNVQMAV